MRLSEYDAIIIGAGFSGAIVAEMMASQGSHVLVIEKRPHIGGNSYDYVDIYGNLIHRYGCHIFHTNDDEVMEYLKEFTRFYEYRHKVSAKTELGTIPLPVNKNSLKILGFDPDDIKSGSEKVYLKDLDNSEIGDILYEHIYSKYTMKQWGIPIEEVSVDTINRIPIYLDYNDEHFRDKYQCLPSGGYTNLIASILSHENIKVVTNTIMNDLIEIEEGRLIDRASGEELKIPVIYTGTLDRLFHYRYGELPFRSTEFFGYASSESLPTCAVNESDSLEVKWTRSIDYSHLQEHPTDRIFIVLEIPHQYSRDEKNSYTFYPIRNNDTVALHQKYLDEVSKFDNLYILGGQATYEDLDMTTTIRRALDFKLERR